MKYIAALVLVKQCFGNEIDWEDSQSCMLGLALPTPAPRVCCAPLEAKNYEIQYYGYDIANLATEL